MPKISVWYKKIHFYSRNKADRRVEMINHVTAVFLAPDLKPCDENPACCSVFLRNSSKSLISVSGNHGSRALVEVGGWDGLPVVTSGSNLTASGSSESLESLGPKKLLSLKKSKQKLNMGSLLYMLTLSRCIQSKTYHRIKQLQCSFCSIYCIMYLNILKREILLVSCNFFWMPRVSRTRRCCSALFRYEGRASIVASWEISRTSVGFRCNLFGLKPRPLWGVTSDARLRRSRKIAMININFQHCNSKNLWI